MALNNLKSVPARQKLQASDLVNLFSMPSPEELNMQDEVKVTCKTCYQGWEVTLTTDHTISRGTVNSLLSHARSHLPGQPGMRRIT